MSNNYKSIIQTSNECYFKNCDCSGPIDIHHVMNGPFRKKSEEWGGLIKVCRFHHTIGGKKSIHGNPGIAIGLKRTFQSSFELLYGHELWERDFKKNYL